MKRTIGLIFVMIFIFSCQNEKETTTIELIFNNKFDSEEIALTTKTYQNSSGEIISLSELKYIISNIEFIKENGNAFRYPVEDSYFLINEESLESQSVTLYDIPVENYKSIRFGIGVDQSNYPLNGVDNFVPTAEENQMLWSWSAGYIFFKMEGNYQTSIVEPEEGFLFHIGSHGTNLDNYKTVELTSEFDLDFTSKRTIYIKADISKVFNAFYDIRINDKSDIQVDPENAPKIAENVSQMFTLSSEINTN